MLTGGLHMVSVTPGLLMSVRSARAKYQEHLDSEKVKKEKEAKAAVGKRKHEDVTIMKDTRRRLERDCAAMEADADKLSEQAEKTSNLTLIAKSNALRRG